MSEDKTLTCVDCGMQYVFSAAEQDDHVKRGYTHEPKRCPPCRESRRRTRPPTSRVDVTAPKVPKQMHMTICASCGKDASVPFVPKPDKPVYCSDCFRDARPPKS